MTTQEKQSRLSDLKVGEPVRVFDINGSRMGQPSGGWEGTVTKVGRKLITVHYGRRSKVFRLDTGVANDDYGHVHVETVEQATEGRRRSALVQRLREGGLEIRFGHSVSTETLAALVAVLDAASK